MDDKLWSGGKQGTHKKHTLKNTKWGILNKNQGYRRINKDIFFIFAYNKLINKHYF